MEPMYDAIIAEDVALGIRLGDEADEKTFLTFLEEFVKPEPESGRLLSSFVIYVHGDSPLLCSAEPEEKKEEKEKVDWPANRPFLYVMNLVRTKHIPGVKRGARTKALAICTQNQHVHIFKPLLLLALDAFFEKPDESIPQGVYNAINSMDFQAFPMLSPQEKRIIRAAEATDDKRFFKAKVTYGGIDLPMKVPLGMYPDEAGDVNHPRLKTAPLSVLRNDSLLPI